MDELYDKDYKKIEENIYSMKKSEIKNMNKKNGSKNEIIKMKPNKV